MAFDEERNSGNIEEGIPEWSAFYCRDGEHWKKMYKQTLALLDLQYKKVVHLENKQTANCNRMADVLDRSFTRGRKTAKLREEADRKRMNEVTKDFFRRGEKYE